MENLLEIVLNSTLLVAIATGVFKIIQEAIKQRKKRKKEGGTFGLLFKKSGEIQIRLDELRREVGATRVLVLSAHNGGGIPTTSDNVKSSVLFESVKEGVSPVFHEWQNQPIDSEYGKLISDMIQSTMVQLQTDQMEDSILKDVYITNGVFKSVVKIIKQTPQRLYYFSLTWDDDKAISDPELRNCLRVARADLGPKLV